MGSLQNYARSRWAFIGAGLVAGVGAMWPGSAAAQTEPMVNLEAGAAGPLTDPQTDWFTWGATGSAAVFGDPVPAVHLGGRVRALRVFDQSAPREALEDPDGGGLYTLSGVLRVRPLAGLSDRRGDGLFLDAAVGPGVTGDLTRLVAEGGIGYLFAAGPVNVGPTARYQHVFQSDGAVESSDAGFLHLGVEVQLFGGQRDEQLEEAIVVAPGPGPKESDEPCPAGPEDMDGFEDDDNCLDADNDQDGIIDPVDDCPNQPETFNGVNDHDGCPDTGELEVVGDRLVLDSNLFFDYDEAVVRESGYDKLREVKDLWESHEEWAGLRIIGHADKRGPKDYNQELSEHRAESVKEVMVSFGMNDNYISTRGYGEPPPGEKGDDPQDYQENRRVDFVVIPGEAQAQQAAGEDPAGDSSDSGASSEAGPGGQSEETETDDAAGAAEQAGDGEHDESDDEEDQ